MHTSVRRAKLHWYLRNKVIMKAVLMMLVVFVSTRTTLIDGTKQTLTFMTVEKTWNEASLVCNIKNGYLYKDGSRTVSEAVGELGEEEPWASLAYLDDPFWIGLGYSGTKIDDKPVFTWNSDCENMDNTNDYNDWHPSQPKFYTTSQCVYRKRAGANWNWYTATCSDKKYYICQTEAATTCNNAPVDDTKGAESEDEHHVGITLSACGTRCTNTKCVAYAFNTATGECLIYIHFSILYFKDPSNQDTASDYQLYLMGCFEAAIDATDYNVVNGNDLIDVACGALSTPEPTTTTTPEPTTTSTPEPTTTTTPEPTTTSTPEPTTTTTPEPTPTSTPEPTTTSTPEPTTTSTPEPTTTSTPELTTTSAPESTTTSTPELTTTTTPEPTTTSTPEPTTTSTPEPTTTTTPESTTTSTPEPTTTTTPESTTTSTPESTTTSTPELTTTTTPEPTTTSTPELTTTTTPEPTTTSAPEPTTISAPEPTTTSAPEPTTISAPEPTTTQTNSNVSTMCHCVCILQSNSTSKDDIVNKIAALRSELIVSKSTLSKTKRSLTCAYDSRISSVSIGTVTSIFLAVCLGAVIVTDLHSVCVALRLNIKKKEGQRWQYPNYLNAKSKSSVVMV